MTNQGTVNLNVANEAPSIDKLWNGRYRLEFLCETEAVSIDWYYEQIGSIFGEFGIAQDTKFGEGNWVAIPSSIYPDMRLVEASLKYVPSINGKRVLLAYETLTASWVQEKDDTVDYELNGLKRVSRTSVALPDTAYESVVGVTTLDSDGTTLYLGKYQIDETDAKWTLSEVWLEAGTLSVAKSSESDGVMKVTTVFFGVQGATVGPIIAEKTDDYEGLPTFAVTTLQDVDGNDLVEGGENLVNQVSGFSQFTYPGLFQIFQTTRTSGGDAQITAGTLLTKAPAACKVATTTYFIFQSSDSVAESDYTYAGSGGLWSPNHWGSIQFTAASADLFNYNDSSTFRGYRTDNSSTGGAVSGGSVKLTWNGKDIFSGQSSIAAIYNVDQGPPDPVGNTYTLDVQINPAFDDVDGNQYYKKTIVVTGEIPTQPITASLPYT